ncbi:MAG: thiolase family protein [Dehalococcoidia bacterium]|nr:thiolase family protein [Dehalococcoidia bacterium]
MSRQAAIVGASRTTGFNKDGRSLNELFMQAAKMAIEDAGLSKKDIDGIIHTQPAGLGADPRLQYRFAEMMGFGAHTKVLDLPHTGGSSSGYANNQARWWLQQGICNYVLVIDGGLARENYVRRGRTSGASVRSYQDSSRSPHPYDWELVFGTGGAYSIYATVAARHMYEFGTTSEQFAAVSVACRKHASMNERAYLRQPITIEDVINSRWISWPHHLLDCAIWAPGAATAYIVTSAERARDCKKPPVWILGAGHAMSYYSISNLCQPSPDGFDIVRQVGTLASDQAFGEASVSRKDIDCLEVYDSFTSTALMTIEDFGFCKKGEGGSFVEGGRIELGGELPLNTHGGLLSEGQSGNGTLFVMYEGISQARGEAGVRQVKERPMVCVGGTSGVISNFGCTILQRD